MRAPFARRAPAPRRRGLSRRLIGRKSLTLLGGAERDRLLIDSAVCMSASTTAAAPSDTSEQSVRFSGPATSGFFVGDIAAES